MASTITFKYKDLKSLPCLHLAVEVCEQIMKMIEPLIFLKWDITVLKAIQVITEAERRTFDRNSLGIEFCKTSC
jgi:hypothetical protein